MSCRGWIVHFCFEGEVDFIAVVAVRGLVIRCYYCLAVLGTETRASRTLAKHCGRGFPLVHYISI